MINKRKVKDPKTTTEWAEWDWDQSPYVIAICTEKNIRFFKNRQYSFDIYAQFTKTEFKKVVQHYFGVQLLSIKVINTDRLEIKGKKLKKSVQDLRENRKGKYSQFMITLKSGVSIFIEPGQFLIIPFVEKDSKKK